MPGFFTDGELASDPGSIFDYDVTAGEAFGSGFGRQFDTNPLALVARQARYLNDDLQNIAGGGVDWVDQEKAAGEVQSRGLDLKIPKGGIARHELDMLQYLKQREIEQNTTSARTRGVGAAAAGFAGGLAASLTDPINVASGFIPIVNQVRYAQWLARAGEGVFARAAVRAGAGAIEGAVGAAIIEPIVYAGATSEQLDYGLMDSFLNVTLGGVLGGGLHVIGGAVYDRAGRGAGAPDVEAALRDAAANMPEATQREMFQSAVAAIERGEPVDVTPVVAKQADEAQARAAADIATIKSKIETLKNDATIPPEVQAAQMDSLHARAEDLHPRAVQSFTTAKGSTYDVHEDGTTTRNKAFRPEHGEAEQGMQPRTERTVYLTPDQASALATPQGSWRLFAHEDGTVSLISPNKNGGWGVSPSAKNVPVSTTPQKGLIPLELWRPDPEVKGPKGTAYRRIHFGNEITDIREAPPRNLADLINQSRADRTQEAFNRQFVDKADETLAAEKARPKDKIESVKQDEAEFRDMVEEYRGQGRVTAEDDASLKQADELAAWAERRAKAFEAAAGCIEAA